ncbi:hypothetical protein MSPP1_003002 [Malassezia sp. CBS 17886]|nr:hypothetical protein MSPP1_003002 [Malassezia sp. CBS 17886]
MLSVDAAHDGADAAARRAACWGTYPHAHVPGSAYPAPGFALCGSGAPPGDAGATGAFPAPLLAAPPSAMLFCAPPAPRMNAARTRWDAPSASHAGAGLCGPAWIRPPHPYGMLPTGACVPVAASVFPPPQGGAWNLYPGTEPDPGAAHMAGSMPMLHAAPVPGGAAVPLGTAIPDGGPLPFSQTAPQHPYAYGMGAAALPAGGAPSMAPAMALPQHAMWQPSWPPQPELPQPQWPWTRTQTPLVWAPPTREEMSLSVPPPVAGAGHCSGAEHVEETGANNRPRTPPADVVDTAVPFAGFGAEALWRATSEFVALRRPDARTPRELQVSATDDDRDSLADSVPSLAPSRCTPSRGGRPRGPPVAASNASPASSSVSTSEPQTPARMSPAVLSVASLPATPHFDAVNILREEDADVRGADACGDAGDAVVDSFALLDVDDAGDGAWQQHTFPSLAQCPPTHAPRGRRRSSGTARRPRTPVNREQPLQGDVNPAFRHFTRQVLAQTLLSPAALFLALYYVRQLRAIVAEERGETRGDTALALLAEPPSTAPFKLLTLGLMMANKFLDDNTFLNKTWYEVTGIPLAELNRMESYFLCRIQFKLMVPLDAWSSHLAGLHADEDCPPPDDVAEQLLTLLTAP